MKELSEPSVSLSSLEQVLEMTKCKDGLSVKKKKKNNKTRNPFVFSYVATKGLIILLI